MKFEGLASEQKGKILLISGFLSIVLVNLIIFLLPRSQGYEISIYSVFGPFFWIVISYILILGIVILMYAINTKYSLFYSAALFFIIIYGLLFFLPILRGYQFSGNIGTDIFYHFSEIFNIINTAHYSQSSIYPLAYISPSILVGLGLPELYTSTLINYLFVLIYILSIFLIGDYFGSGKSENKIFFFVASLPLFYSVFYINFYPFIYALLIFPLTLFSMIMFTSSIDGIYKKKYICIFIILSFFIIFLHPIVALFLILSIISLLIAKIVYFNRMKKIESRFFYDSTITDSLLLLSITFLFWIISSIRLSHTLSDIYSELSLFGEDAVMTQSVASAIGSGADIWYIIDLFIKRYYSVSLYLVLASIISFIIIYRFVVYKKINLKQLQLVVLFSLSVITSLILSLTYAAMGFLERSFSFSLVIGTIVIGFFISELFTKNDRLKKFISYFLICLVIISILISVFGLYPSPWKSLPNSQTSLMELNGYAWSISHTDDRYSIPFLSFTGKIDKFVRYHDTKFSSKYRYYETINFKVNNFGYDKNQNYFSKSLVNLPSYLIVTKYMNTYQNCLPENRRDKVISFDEYSNYRLEYADPSVNKIYSNGEFKEFFVVKLGKNRFFKIEHE